MQGRLEKAFISGGLQRTGNSYTTDSRKYSEYEEEFLPQQHQEYEYNGGRYVRIKANSCYNGGEILLSNGERYQDGDYIWIEVSPVWSKHTTRFCKSCYYARSDRRRKKTH